jgi:hypothetical protein
MTTIITTTGNNSATLVADRGITSDLILPDMPKIVQQGSWLIGVAGNARVCDQLQYLVEYPEPPADVVKSGEWLRWIVTNVIARIDDVIKDIVTLVIHPTYTRPTAGLSMGSSGDFEIGTNLGTLTYSPNFTQNDGGSFTAISYKKN